jgi:hypothetical protein
LFRRKWSSDHRTIPTDLLNFLVIFKCRKIALGIAKKTLFDESVIFLTDEEFVFGDFSNVENKENSGSLDSLVLSHQGERT